MFSSSLLAADEITGVIWLMTVDCPILLLYSAIPNYIVIVVIMAIPGCVALSNPESVGPCIWISAISSEMYLVVTIRIRRAWYSTGGITILLTENTDDNARDWLTRTISNFSIDAFRWTTAFGTAKATLWCDSHAYKNSRQESHNHENQPKDSSVFHLISPPFICQ